MSGEGFQLFGFVASVVSTLALTQIVYVWLRDATPSAKMRALETMLSETEALLRSALEEGTIDYGFYDVSLRSRLWSIKVCADEYRAQVYAIKSCWVELAHWLGGLSGNIAAVIDDLGTVRGEIAASSTKGRKRLGDLGQTADPALEHFARRDTLTELTLPDSPADAASKLKSYTLDNMTPPSHTAPVTSHVQRASDHPSFVDSEHSTRAPPEYTEPHPFPPLVFRTKEKAAFSVCRVERAVLHLSGNPSCSPRAESVERRGFPNLFRIVSGFFHRLWTTVVPPIATSSTPLLPRALSEKGTHFQTAQWEENGHIVFQIKLPV